MQQPCGVTITKYKPQLSKNFKPLKDGIKILFLAKISFDRFLTVTQIIDIDPQFTLGDLEKKRQPLKIEGRRNL
jgi:hypothetical protein